MLVIGEKINASNRSVAEAIARRDEDFLVNLARRQDVETFTSKKYPTHLSLWDIYRGSWERHISCIRASFWQDCTSLPLRRYGDGGRDAPASARADGRDSSIATSPYR